MTCIDCENALLNGWVGTYSVSCVDCCTRSVVSARPSKAHQNAMLSALVRFPMSPTKANIISQINK